MTRLRAWEAAKARLCSSARFRPACRPQRGLALVTASRNAQIHSKEIWSRSVLALVPPLEQHSGATPNDDLSDFAS